MLTGRRIDDRLQLRMHRDVEHYTGLGLADL